MMNRRVVVVDRVIVVGVGIGIGEIEDYYKINLEEFYKVHAIPAHRPQDHFLIAPAILVFLMLVLMIVYNATITAQPV
jgi:hypothetical protein